MKRFVQLTFILVIGVLLTSIVIGRLGKTKTTTFQVTIPSYTPELDTITIHIETKILPMQKITPALYQLTINNRDYEAGKDLRYGYSRGGNSIFGEDSFLGNVGGRTFILGKNAIINDKVVGWKWLPAEKITVDISSIVDSTTIATRPKFWAGPNLVDFWNPQFSLQFESTIDHLKKLGYQWIQLDPPWDYQSIDPPIITDQNVEVPAWSEEELRHQIRIFKQAGFKILLGPQVCCSAIDFKNRSIDWWNQWYDQYEQFLSFHIDLSREEKIDALIIGGPEASLPKAPEAPDFAQERWQKMIEIAKTVNIPIAFNYHILPPDDQPQLLWPQEATKFFDQVDFLAVSLWNPVSDKEFPSQEEIVAGFSRIFRDLDHVHQQSQKPVVFTQVAYFSRKGAALPKGPEEFPTWEDPVKHQANYDAKTQAMIYEGLMRGIAERSYIQGIFPFGYWYADIPLNLDSDIRSKPAETIFVDWIKKIQASSN